MDQSEVPAGALIVTRVGETVAGLKIVNSNYMGAISESEKEGIQRALLK